VAGGGQPETVEFPRFVEIHDFGTCAVGFYGNCGAVPSVAMLAGGAKDAGAVLLVILVLPVGNSHWELEEAVSVDDWEYASCAAQMEFVPLWELGGRAVEDVGLQQGIVAALSVLTDAGNGVYFDAAAAAAAAGDSSVQDF